MKSGTLQIQLAEHNPWWRPGDWARDDVDLVAAAEAGFTYRSGALAHLTQGGLYVLRGPRRVGKSTEIKMAIRDLLDSGVPARSVIHAAVDGWRAEDLRTLVPSATRSFLGDAPRPRWWFIDEITNVRGDWPNVVKNMRDNDPGFARDTVVLTGSSAAGLHAARKALAGRRGQATDADREILPMRFTDVVAASGLDVNVVPPLRPKQLVTPEARDRVFDLAPYLSELVTLWETYLRVGGFPQAVTGWLRTGELERPFVDALWDVIHGEAINTERLAATQTSLLLSKLARNLCSPLNVSDLARDLDVAQQTAGERLRDLADHFLIWPCFREQGGRPRPSAQRKWYFVDPALARLASIRSGGYEPDFTQLSQQQIGLCLLRTAGADDAVSLADFDAVLHHRTSTGAEIDFVGARFQGVAVESKYVDDRWGREMQTIARSPWSGIIASRSGIEWRPDGSVIPAPLLALVLGA